MAQPLVISGALVRLYVNNRVYSVAQSVTLDMDTGEYEIRGINPPYPQEIAGGGQVQVKGSVKGIRIKNSAGVQGSNARPLFFRYSRFELCGTSFGRPLYREKRFGAYPKPRSTTFRKAFK